MLKEYYFGLLHEDELFDELSRRVQSQEEGIDEFINIFSHKARHLRHPPSINKQLDMV